MEILSIIGSVVSIISAVVAVYQAIKARNAATAAEEAKSSIQKQTSTLNLQELLSHAKRIETLLIKLTSDKSTPAKGRNFKKDHEALENFVSFLNDNQSVHPDKELCKLILSEYEWLVANFRTEPKPYDEILYHVRRIIREIKRIINNRTFD